MEDTSGTFMWKLVKTLRGEGIRPLIVAKSVIDELDRLEADRDEATSRKARNAKLMVKALLDEGDAEIIGEKGDGVFADNLFQTVFTRLRLKYRLLLVTQDRSLAKDILSLNSSASVDGIRGIDAFRIGDRGVPMRWTLDPSHSSGVKYVKPDSQKSPERRESEKSAPSVAPFRLRQRAIQLDDTPITITLIPDSGDIVKDARGFSLRLGEKLGSGGEGTAFQTDAGLVCKVYQHGRFKLSTIAKIELMTSREVRHRAICWPVSLAYNSRGEVVGYLMPEAKGEELMRTVFIPPLLREKFPHWTRRDLAKLTSTILDAVAHLHSLNVLLGDINARNILVQDESTVCFVDCDSYQVEGFPCPVGMPPYLSPELYGKELRSTLRTLEHEHFAIATLVFMLLLPGKPPYSHQGGEDPSKNAQKKHFPYPLGDRRGSGVPSGPWRFMWSHLPRYMKEAFHKVFSSEAKLSERLSITEWQEIMQRYENDLGNGYVSDEVFPKGFKQLNQSQAEQAGIPWRSCEVCGRGFAAYKGHFTQCDTCFKSRSDGGRVSPT